MNWSVNWVKELPYSITWGISINWAETFIIYITLLLLTFAFVLKRTKLFLYGGITIILLLSILIIRDQSVKSKNELIIYNIKDEIALDLFYGKSNILMTSESLRKDQDKLLFNIEHYWYYKNGQEQPNKFYDLAHIKSSILKLKNKTISICNNKKNQKYYKTDYVLIGDIGYINNLGLSVWQNNETVLIIHQKCNYKTRNFLKLNYPKHLLHDLKLDGAFTFSF